MFADLLLVDLVRLQHGFLAGALLLAADAPRGTGPAPAAAAGGAFQESGPQRANRPPTLTSSVGTALQATLRETLELRLTASDPDGDLVSLRLLNPPPVMVFQPVHGGASPVSVDARWIIPVSWGGVRQLLFEAHDDDEPSQKTRLTVVVTIDGMRRTVGGGSGFLASAFDPAPIQTADVTGDGVLDVLAVASAADVGAAADAGAVYVWRGGASPGSSPSATLTVPGAAPGDQLGIWLLRTAEVTGDGVLDVVAGSPYADRAGETDVGAVYVFAGGAGLVGSVAPTATLSVAGTGSAELGIAEGQGVYFVDLSGDGQLDVVAASSYAENGGFQSGAVYLWEGGPGLSPPTWGTSISGRAAAGRGLGRWLGGRDGRRRARPRHGLRARRRRRGDERGRGLRVGGRQLRGRRRPAHRHAATDERRRR